MNVSPRQSTSEPCTWDVTLEGSALVAQLFRFLSNKLTAFHKGKNWERETPKPHAYTACCTSPKGWLQDNSGSHLKRPLDQISCLCASSLAAHVTGLFCSIFCSSPIRSCLTSATSMGNPETVIPHCPFQGCGQTRSG